MLKRRCGEARSAVVPSNLKYCNGSCVWGGLWRCVAGSGRAAARRQQSSAEKLENVIGSAVVIYSRHVQAKAEHSRFHPRPLGFGPPRDHVALPAALFPPQQSRSLWTQSSPPRALPSCHLQVFTWSKHPLLWPV